MKRAYRCVTLALAALFCGGCAGKRIRRENALALTAADGRVLEGCFACLAEARARYERLAASKYSNRDTLALRLFETSLLLTLREKELALDWRPSAERAGAIAKRVPASIDAARLLMIASAVMPDGTGRPGDWPVELRREWRDFVAKVPGEIAFLGTVPLRPVVRDYLALALDCSYDARVLAPVHQRGAKQRRPVLPADAPPIITYRTGICMSAETAMLEAVIALVPRFHEAAYFAGSAAAFFAEEDGGAKAAPLLAEAYEHFPRAPGVSFMRGWLADVVGECSEALRHFDIVLALDAAHEFAHLQRTVCLSRLHRDTEAVASATTLIDLRTKSTQPAYYWRAVSRLRLKELQAARSDIDSAKALARDANALTLGGIIENEQSDLAIAETDLREARALPRGEQNCTAVWTLGLVIGKTSRPSEAAQVFESAMDCYDTKVAVARFAIQKLLERPSPHPAYRAKRIAAIEADSADQRKRYFASAFNAAGQIANAGKLSRALELLDVAARDSTLATPIATLRKAILAARQ
jgi:tetratricopeptide (TPR) repeat protein